MSEEQKQDTGRTERDRAHENQRDSDATQRVWFPYSEQIRVSLDELRHLVAEYELAQAKELDLARELAEREAAFALEDATMIQVGYDTGDIVGKNAAERDRAEAIYLANAEGRDDELARTEDLRHRYEVAKAARQALELKASLLKAYLYSQSGGW